MEDHQSTILCSYSVPATELYLFLLTSQSQTRQNHVFRKSHHLQKLSWSSMNPKFSCAAKIENPRRCCRRVQEGGGKGLGCRGAKDGQGLKPYLFTRSYLRQSKKSMHKMHNAVIQSHTIRCTCFPHMSSDTHTHTNTHSIALRFQSHSCYVLPRETFACHELIGIGLSADSSGCPRPPRQSPPWDQRSWDRGTKKN